MSIKKLLKSGDKELKGYKESKVSRRQTFSPPNIDVASDNQHYCQNGCLGGEMFNQGGILCKLEISHDICKTD